MMGFDREQAWSIVCEFVQSDSLRKHMLAVEAAMAWYAADFGQDPTEWQLAGLLHDFDWEIHPTLAQHPQAGAAILRSRGVPEHLITAILSHADHLAVPRSTLLEKTLYACDELTGLITAAVLVRPSRSIYDLTVPSIKKKWKDKAFAAGVKRSDVEAGAQALGIELWLHVANVIAGMQAAAPQLGLVGTLSPL
jgi:putative nucleotidyltransferase with HDIG domain